MLDQKKRKSILSANVQNNMNWLSDDYSNFNARKFFNDTNFSRSQTANTLKIARASIYKDHLLLNKANQIRERILHLVIVADIAYNLFESDKLQVAKWLTTPNTHFFGSSPIEVCFRGDGKTLIEWIHSKK